MCFRIEGLLQEALARCSARILGKWTLLCGGARGGVAGGGAATHACFGAARLAMARLGQSLIGFFVDPERRPSVLVRASEPCGIGIRGGSFRRWWNLPDLSGQLLRR